MTTLFRKCFKMLLIKSSTAKHSNFSTSSIRDSQNLNKRIQKVFWNRKWTIVGVKHCFEFGKRNHFVIPKKWLICTIQLDDIRCNFLARDEEHRVAKPILKKLENWAFSSNLDPQLVRPLRHCTNEKENNFQSKIGLLNRNEPNP